MTARIPRMVRETAGRGWLPPAGDRPGQLVELGQVLATPGALRALETTGEKPAHYLARHAAGDWGELDEEDRAANDRALRVGERILSAYSLPDGERLWIITEAGRSATVLLLPAEY